MDTPQRDTESDGAAETRPPVGRSVVPAQSVPAGVAGAAAATPAGGEGAVVPRGRRLRLVLAVVSGVVTLLCLGGVGIGIALYDKATEIDRVSPDGAATQFLTSKFVQRNDQRASLVTCPGADLSQADTLVAETVRRERDLGVGISVNVENVAVSQKTAQSAQVTADIRRSATVDGVRQSLVDRVVMTVEDRDGWRVCGVTRIEQ